MQQLQLRLLQSRQIVVTDRLTDIRSNVKKWGNVAILSFLTLLTPLASSMFAPGVPQLIKDFDVTRFVVCTGPTRDDTSIDRY